MDKLDQARAEGYEGMRVAGDAAPLIERDWVHLIDYETKVNDSIGKYRMIEVCTYPLEKCGSSEVVDVICAHQFMLTKRVDEWECLKISVSRKSKNGMQTSPDTIEGSSRSYTVETDGVAALDREGIQPPLNSKTIVISGYESFTRDIAAQDGLDYFCIDLELDPFDFEIVDFACTKMPCLGEMILRDALLGYKVEVGVKNAIDQVEKRLSFPLKSGIIAALEDANRWYKKMKEERK